MHPQGVLWSDRGGGERARLWNRNGAANCEPVGTTRARICLWHHRRRRAGGVLSTYGRGVRDSRQPARNLYGFVEVGIMVLPKHNPSINELARIISANKNAKNTRRPPGPKGEPIMGVMREFNHDQLGFIERARREYGDVVWMRFLYVPALFLYHPDAIEYVLVTNPKNFIKAMSLRSNFFHRLVANGFLTSQGEDGKVAGRCPQTPFHRDRVASYANVMVDYTNRLTAKWQEEETTDLPVDMIRLTLEIVVPGLFSADVSHDVDDVCATLKELVKPFASQATLGW